MNKNKTVVITGASSGLGSCLLKSFSESHHIVNISRTKTACEINIIANFENLSNLKQKLGIENIKHSLCILNAGTMGSIGTANNIKATEFIEAFKVNVFANKIIIDWSILNGCQHFIGISSGAAIKNYDGWLNYCATKAAFRSMLLQYQKDLTKLNFKLISPGILGTGMNKKIKDLDISIYPDMKKFHLTPAADPQKAAKLIYQKHDDFFKNDTLEIDLRNEEKC